MVRGKNSRTKRLVHSHAHEEEEKTKSPAIGSGYAQISESVLQDLV